MFESILTTSKHLLVFAKDLDSKYLFCNETFAEAAGLDSPQQIVGKSDKELIWRKKADVYIGGDQNVLRGKSHINVLESLLQITKNAKLLTTKTLLLNEQGKRQGILGHCIDITGNSIYKTNGYLCEQKNIFYLGEYFNNEYLTKREFEIFKYLLLGKSVAEISCILSRSDKTIQTQITHIANKLQCSYKSEIVPTAIKYGLTHVLDNWFSK